MCQRAVRKRKDLEHRSVYIHTSVNVLISEGGRDEQKGG